MLPRSLTVRLAAMFAFLALVLLGSVGVGLYDALETQLIVRDDAALVSRVEQIRTILQDANTMQLVHEKPRLFENMLGNREGVLIMRFPGKNPLIEVNPGGISVPNLEPVPADVPLTLNAVKRYLTQGGTPFSALTADAKTTESGVSLQVTAGRVMNERTRILELYRKRIIVLVIAGTAIAALLAVLLVARGLTPLKHLAEQTERIGVDNLTARINPTNIPNELAPLIASFNGMLERLESSFSKLSNVSADMAHDLRTPIGNLLGQTEVALGQVRNTEYYQNLLASNLEELQRLSRMTDNMLFLARSDNAEFLIESTFLDITAEFARVADYFEGLADERGLSIKSAGGGFVLADPLLLRRALANLVANAVQYADPSTVISLSTEVLADRLVLHVDNVGPSIPERQCGLLFERFYRADTARRGSAQSSGLGLSIVQSVMVLHGGEVRVYSSNGATRFSLFFPHNRPKQRA